MKRKGKGRLQPRTSISPKVLILLTEGLVVFRKFFAPSGEVQVTG